MKSFLPIFVFFSTLAIISSAFAHYGARFEPADGHLYHGCGWNYHESVALYSDMFPDDHHPFICLLAFRKLVEGLRSLGLSESIQFKF